MSSSIVVGAQWGDEGKGKIVDYLTEGADVVVRSQGGNNAGHTVISGGEKYILHLIPSGILWEEKFCVIGNGVVMDPVSLLNEIDGLADQGVHVSSEQLMISDRAHVVMPYHRGLDLCNEKGLGKRKIGTTGRGIGPTYGDKIGRTGIRLADLDDPVWFTERFAELIEEHNMILEAGGQPVVDYETSCKMYLDAWERLEPFVGDTATYLSKAVAGGKTLLFEGAQGTYLDIDHGTYPFVTSSNTTAGGALTGSGAPLRCIDRVVGVAKAYTTRVGAGPFTTEDQAMSDKFHGMGREFGATTGRERRCGWLDGVMLRYAVIVNGIDELAVTILDGLDDFEKIRVCVGYELDGERLDVPPANITKWEACEPIYKDVDGWQTPLDGIRKFSDLPKNARAYLDLISELAGAPITFVGVGPDREQTLVVS